MDKTGLAGLLAVLVLGAVGSYATLAVYTSTGQPLLVGSDDSGLGGGSSGAGAAGSPAPVGTEQGPDGGETPAAEQRVGIVDSTDDTDATADDAFSAVNESLDYRTDSTLRFQPGGEDLSYRPVDTYTAAQEFVSNSGAYAADYDRDGWTDLLLVGGEGPVLYHNDGGEFRRSGQLPAVDGPVQSAHFLDYDGDGDRDLLLFRTDDTPVALENDGGEFRRHDAGLPELSMPYAPTSGDYDGDGCPDLFVGQYGDWREATPGGRPHYDRSLDADTGFESRLFDGDCGSFTEATDRAGLAGKGWSLATATADFDGDGTLDVYVANDYNRDVRYLNRGDGTFERRPLGERTNRNGMSAEVTDVNRDGVPDVFVTNIFFTRPVAETFVEDDDHLRGNTMLVGDGDGGFTDRASGYGVRRGGQGWAATFADFDNDGDRDLFHTTRAFAYPVLVNRFAGNGGLFRFYEYPVVRERRGDRFVPVRADAAGFLGADGRGVARLDYDRDGDQDLVVADADGPFRTYENVGATGHAVQFALRDEGPTTGATVTVTANGTTDRRFHTTGSDFLSQDTRVHHFGTGPDTSVTATVTWPDGTEQRLSGVATGQRLVLDRSGVVARYPFTDREP